ncbi:MAG: hypothetical protein FWF81_15090 [Defluviitaleaceae bacterium]|nr:hypothetical protein [Defluviitaleaceae bacterium]
MHGTIRAATLKTILEMIIEHFSADENTAIKMFYESHTGKCFADDSTGLYGQSAVYIFSLFMDEKGLLE